MGKNRMKKQPETDTKNKNKKTNKQANKANNGKKNTKKNETKKDSSLPYDINSSKYRQRTIIVR